MISEIEMNVDDISSCNKQGTIQSARSVIEWYCCDVRRTVVFSDDDDSDIQSGTITFFYYCHRYSVNRFNNY